VAAIRAYIKEIDFDKEYDRLIDYLGQKGKLEAG
jgi:hypothetical protein